MGTMSEEDREKHKRVFINNPDYKVMLGTIGSMGESVTLTVAENIIFYDDCWTYADKMQCIKRANRIGSTKPLKVVTLMSKDTIDERVRQIIDTKQGIAGYIVDENIDLRQNPQLFDFLLGRENV
jgi:SNF2 family DNA or RNA helicase